MQLRSEQVTPIDNLPSSGVDKRSEGLPHDAALAKAQVRPWRWVWTIAVGLGAFQFGRFLILNPRWEWSVAGEYLFHDAVLSGVRMTILMTILCMGVGTVVGVIIALMRLSNYWLTRAVAVSFVGFFRSIPLLVQLIFWFNLAYLIPNISIGIPGLPAIASTDTNQLVTTFVAAILGLGLNEGGQMAEVIRSGILSVDRGQSEAARALGMTPRLTFRRIVLPQAIRVIIPPTATQFGNLLKATSLVSVISMADLLYSVQTIYNETFQIIPLLLTACCWYFVMVVSLQVVQSVLERKYGRGYE